MSGDEKASSSTRSVSSRIDSTVAFDNRASTWLGMISRVLGEILSRVRAREISARERKVNALTCDADGTRNRAGDVRDK